MNILEMAALAGRQLAAQLKNGNGNGHSVPETAAKGARAAAAATNLDPDLLQIELADARFRASGSKPEDFYMEGEG